MKQMFQKCNPIIFNELNVDDEKERSVNDDFMIFGVCKQFYEGTVY